MSKFSVIDNIIQKRAYNGYSIDSARNLQLLLEEYDFLMSNVNQNVHENEFGLIRDSQELFRVWSWVSRIESLKADEISYNNINSINIEISIVSKLESESSTADIIYGYHNVTKVPIYLSSNRTLGRFFSGWVEMKDVIVVNNTKTTTKSIEYDNTLLDIVSECEQVMNFERASFLALVHGDLQLSVKILKDTIDKYSCSPRGYSKQNVDRSIDMSLNDDQDLNNLDESLSESYINIISMVAICLAGYNNSYDPTSANEQVLDNKSWISMCKHIIKLLETSSRPNSNYLRLNCFFLIYSFDFKNLRNNYFNMLKSTAKALDDKLGFACTFFPIDLLIKWLKEELSESKDKGNVEGLILSGISQDGMQILQKYLDNSSDIQTCALLASNRIISQSYDKNMKPSLEYQWLYEYRNLLNKYQMFIERSKFDVCFGKIQREYINESSTTSSQGNFGLPINKSSSSNMNSRNTTSNTDNKSKSSGVRQLYVLPNYITDPHLLLRCHYCGTALPLDISQQQQQQATSAFLRKQKPIMNCCASCKRQLPRCYVCQLYMGLANPNLEFHRLLAQKRRQNDLTASAKDKTKGNAPAYNEQNVLDIGQWFCFCQKCKHGGHANCIEEWFGNLLINNQEDFHNINYTTQKLCGVNGCTCICTIY